MSKKFEKLRDIAVARVMAEQLRRTAEIESQHSRDEWNCEHGCGHPIPGVKHHGGGIHGCDGCCSKVKP